MRIELGYPDATAERALLQGADRRDLLPQLSPAMLPDEMVALQRQVRDIHASNALLDYLQALVDYSRKSPDYVNGLSPRAALAMLNAARAWAMMDNRHQVLPEDLQAIFPGVVGHRLFNARDHAAADRRCRGSVAGGGSDSVREPRSPTNASSPYKSFFKLALPSFGAPSAELSF